MIITQPAWMCLVATGRRLTGQRPVKPAPSPPESALSQPNPAVQPVAAVALAKIEPQRASAAAEGSTAVAASTPLTASERRARAAALRGLALGRQRRFDAARAAFAEAARLDPLLDLTRTPGFWRLERAAHEAAIAAYDDSGRDRDAAVLRARVRSTFRPKPVRPLGEVLAGQ